MGLHVEILPGRQVFAEFKVGRDQRDPMAVINFADLHSQQYPEVSQVCDFEQAEDDGKSKSIGYREGSFETESIAAQP